MMVSVERDDADSLHSHIVHQEDLSLHEKILRHFDLSTQYGVCCLCDVLSTPSFRL